MNRHAGVALTAVLAAYVVLVGCERDPMNVQTAPSASNQVVMPSTAADSTHEFSLNSDVAAVMQSLVADRRISEVVRDAIRKFAASASLEDQKDFLSGNAELNFTTGPDPAGPVPQGFRCKAKSCKVKVVCDRKSNDIPDCKIDGPNCDFDPGDCVWIPEPGPRIGPTKPIP